MALNRRQFVDSSKWKPLTAKKRETDCANTEGILRIIPSILSPKAEPSGAKVIWSTIDVHGRIASRGRKCSSKVSSG